jgi:magnesium-transporting ATPase (P-type)
MAPLGRLLKRGKQEPAAAETAEQPAAADADGTHSPEGSQERQVFFRRWAKQVGRTLRRRERQAGTLPAEEAPPAEEARLLFAYHPQAVPLYDAQGNVRIPEGLIPLCELHYTRRLRPEVLDIVRGFARTGVRIKVFAADEPERLRAMLRAAGWHAEDEERVAAAGTISGSDLERMPPTEWGRAAAKNALFGAVTPAQAGALVRAMRENGESVAVVGDGVTDLPALQEANLAIARQTSTQAALGVADIVLMGNSPYALLEVLHRGQAIVHGLLDILKLNLTQVICLALLIVAIQAVSVGFPHVSAQGTAIALITVTIPSVGLSLWATAGAVSSAHLGRILARFVVPASASMSALALAVYVYFLDRSGRVAYAQLAVTYTLIYAGLLLSVFIKPPRPAWKAGQKRSRAAQRDGAWAREWRMTGLVLFLGVATFFLPAVPGVQRHLRLDWLRQPADYGLVGLAVLAWALVLLLVWWLLPPERENRSRM